MNTTTLKNEKKSLFGIVKTSLCIGLALFISLSFIGCSKDNTKDKPAQSAAEKNGAAAKNLKKFTLITCPEHKPSSRFIIYSHLANYLQKNTGFEIKLFHPKDFKEFKEFKEFKDKIKNKEIDFLFVNPVVYLEVEDFINKNHLYARLSGLEGELEDKPFETACLIARPDSMIKTIKDVKGKSVIFGSQRSATNWISARKLFMDNGVDIEKDLAEYRFVNKCKDIALDIFYQKADVGCIRTLVCPICINSIFGDGPLNCDF